MSSSEFSIDPEELAPEIPRDSLDLEDSGGEDYHWEVFSSLSLNGNEYMIFLPPSDKEQKFINLEWEDADSEIPGFIVLRLETEESTGEEILVEVLDPSELLEIRDALEEDDFLSFGLERGE